MASPERLLTPEIVMKALSQHSDPEVQKHTKYLIGQHELTKQVLRLVRDTLAEVRTDIKYLVFDLEATRRERDELRGQV